MTETREALGLYPPQRPRIPKGFDGFLHLGATGSRHGASGKQMDALRWLTSMLPVDRLCLHHGSCTGFDKQAYDFFCGLRIPMIVSHPPIKTEFLADCPPRKGYPDAVKEAQAYTTRDIEIAASSSVLFAAPELPIEQAPRRGTWFTVRRGWGRGIPVFVLPRGAA